MEHITRRSRAQISFLPESIEDYITEDNSVRFIDAFVDSLDIEALGFKHAVIKQTGRPPFNPKDLLKLQLYGYINQVTSSRKLEKETKRNLEVLWLLGHLTPDHKTISNFRAENTKAIRGVFKEFHLLCDKLKLYGRELVAVDSSKFKASNSRANVLDRDTLKKKIKIIEDSIASYLKQLEDNDSFEHEESELTKEELSGRIDQLRKKKDKLEQAENNASDCTDKNISLTDSDCRLIKDKNGIEPAYRMQTSVDSKHSLIVDYQMTSDAADNKHLSEMAIRTKQTLQTEELVVAADAGYYDGQDIKICEGNNIIVHVPIPKGKGSHHSQQQYQADKFLYDEQTDTYLCPEGQTLVYKRTDKKHSRNIRIYHTGKCIACRNKHKCTSSPRGREINRWEDEAVIDRLKQRLQNNPEIIKKRKGIVEHVFGTIKRIWNYYALKLRGLKNVETEAALMCLTYNIRRSISILGTKKLIMAIKKA